MWKYILRGQDPPDWVDRPAIARTSVSTPTMHRLFAPLNQRKPYPEQVKPFNFLNAAFVHPTERPADDERILLIAPYEPNPQRWAEQQWINRFNGRPYRITTEPSGGRVRRCVTVKTYDDVIAEYATHPEQKSLGPDGQPCDRTTIGLVSRRLISPTVIQHIGKESNRLEDTQAGLLDASDDPLNVYGDSGLLMFRELITPILRHLGTRETKRLTGLGLGSVSAALGGRSIPRAAALAQYLDVALDHATKLLTAAGVHAAESDEGKLRQVADLLR